MKLIIKSNAEMKKAKMTSEKEITRKLENVQVIEIDFEPSTFYSDFEFWLETEDGEKYLDHSCLNVTRRNKLQSYK